MKQWSTTEVLEYSRHFSHALMVQSNGLKAAMNLGPYRNLLALGAEQELLIPEGETDPARVQDWLQFMRRTAGAWRFGYLGYAFRQLLEDLPARHTDSMGAAAAHWWVPALVLEQQSDGNWQLIKGEAASLAQIHKKITPLPLPKVQWKELTDRDTYLKDVAGLKEEIAAGNIYEINYCMALTAEHVQLDAVTVYQRMNELSQMPFSAFLKTGNLYAMCTSPERFLMKMDGKIWSQPIKGTIRRGTDPEEDEKLKVQLYHDLKERAENIMIVDLVRNDLARSAVPGSVKVEELFGIYTFQRLHQMISTVSAELQYADGLQAIMHAFPMGSMTGAPKISAMQLIDTYEKTARGLYAGSIGYFDPNGDFDLNVVIRTLLYREDLQTLSYHAGSAITYTCDPASEYEECRLKAAAMRAVFSA